MIKKIVLIIIFMTVIPLHAADKIKVSVLYFENISKNKDFSWLTKGIADMLISDLSSSDDLVLVEREDLQKVINEQHFSQTGFADNADAVKIGKIFNAEKIISGSFFLTGNDLRIDVKVINTTTAEVKSASATGYFKDLVTIEKRLLQALFKILDLEYPPGISIDTNSYFAVQNYYEGVDLLDNGMFQLALEKFEKAEEFDPLYDKPQLDKEKAYLFLKNFKKARFHRELSVLFKEANEILKRMDQKPFLQYADVLKNSDWINMSETERKEFNKKYYYYIAYTSPLQCAAGFQGKLFEIISKREEMLSEEWDAEDDKFDKNQSDINKKYRDERKILDKRKNALSDKHRKDKDDINSSNDEKDVKKEKLSALDRKYREEIEKVNAEIESLRTFYENKLDLSEKSIEEFEKKRELAENDLAVKNKILYDKIITIADKIEASGKKDSEKDQNYQMVLYYRLLSLRMISDYDNLRVYCESYMKMFPDARMMWAVEDMYEYALEKSE
ncbi:MAG: hypothetical protein JW982_13005 [Spirochaetes bacterium]|nr:hypothetical protein [Spirochaetota bacterium]